MKFSKYFLIACLSLITISNQAEAEIINDDEECSMSVERIFNANNNETWISGKTPGGNDTVAIINPTVVTSAEARDKYFSLALTAKITGKTLLVRFDSIAYECHRRNSSSSDYTYRINEDIVGMSLAD